MEEKITETFWYIIAGIVALLTVIAKTVQSITTAHKAKPGSADAAFQGEVRKELKRLNDEMICQRSRVNQALIEVAELRGPIKKG